MPILLHSIFNIVHKLFMLLPDGGFSEETKPDNMRRVTITKSLVHKNAWACLEWVEDEDVLGFNNFDKYIKNIEALQRLTQKNKTSYSLFTDGFQGPQMKIIHQMFEVCDNIDECSLWH